MILRKLFHKKPPDGLLEISERVYVFDCCFSTNVWKEETFKVYMKGTVSNLVNHFPDSSFLVFNFCEDETKSHMAELLANYDMTIMDYPRQYEGCPLLAMEMLHHFLRSSESWLSLGQHNFLLMHCEWGGWPVMAFMLSALLIYMKQYRRELKTLDMIYCQAPHELLRLLSPLNPIPSQLRYLQYVARRNVASEWPPADRALTLDCIILRHIPNVDGNGGCRPIFRIYGQDPLLVADKTPKVLYSTPKRSSSARYYKERVSALVKIDINCHVQGDVVVECISLSNDMEREEMIFRAAFNTAFIRSNILMLNCDEIDTLWDAKELFPKEFRAEILFSEMDAASSTISLNFPTFEEKEGLPMEAFAKVHEIFNGVDWSDPKTDVAFDMLRQMGDSNFLQEKSDSDQNNSVVVSPKQHGLNSENVKAETGSLSQQSTLGPSTMDRKIPYALSKQTSLDSDTSVETKPQDSHVDHFNQSNVTNQQNNQSIAESILHDSSEVSHLNALSEAVVNHSLAASPKIEAENKIISLAPPTPSAAVQPPSISCTTKAPPQPPLSPPLLTPLSSVSTSEKSSPTKDSGTQTQDKDQSAFAKGTLRHKTLHPAATSKTSSSTSSLAAPPPPPAPPLKDNQTISNIHTETPRATHVSPKEPLSLKENLVLRLNTPAASVDTPASPQNESAAVRKGCPAVPSSPPLAPVRTRCPVAPPPPPPKMSLKENSAFRSASPPHLSQVASLAASSSAPPPPSHSSQVTSPAASSIPPHPPYSSQVASPAGSSSAPPPPPPLSSSSSPRNKLLSRTISSKSNQKKLKPLHWLKLSRAVQGSLWAEAQKLGEASKTPEIDMSELENLFSAAAPKTNNGVKSNSRAPHAPKTDKVQLVELRRACNCEIMLSKVKMPLPELMNSVLALEESALDIDQVENLIKFCPTKEEMEALKGYTGEREKLGKCEQFFLELMRAPRVESKLNVFAFKIEFRSQVSDLRNRLNVVNSATEEIRTSVKLKRIMQTILTLGNALNQGTARGSAVGFRLDSLLKLTDTRARNNKITLMHYLCKVVADKLPDLLDFSDEIPSLEPASKVELKYLAEEMQSISKGLEKVVQELSSSESDGPTSEKFCKTLKEFLSFAEAEVRSLTSLYAGVGRNVDALIVYFGEDPAHCPFEQVTATLLNFVKMFNKAREDTENSKKLEQEIKKSAEVEKQNAQNDPAYH